MPSSYFSNPIIFLVEVLFGLYIGIIALRLIMQWAQWEYNNPLVQFIVRATQSPVKLLRKFIPPLGRWDSATIVLLLLATALKLFFLSVLKSIPYAFTIFIPWLVFDIFSLFITLFTASILIEVVLGWLTARNGYNPIMPLVQRMNSPLLTPLRRWLPPMAGLDFSPFIAIITLQILLMLVRPLLIGF
ncbi:MAG: YggT family protein [Methylophaga sp.]|nr:MAG: YggT family protein [Methylophaga sp.]